MWDAWIREHLPLDETGDVYLRDVDGVAIVRGVERTVTLRETVPVATVIAMFGEALGPTLPDGNLPDETYNALLARSVGSPLWREHWQRWRGEGRI